MQGIFTPENAFFQKFYLCRAFSRIIAYAHKVVCAAHALARRVFIYHITSHSANRAVVVCLPIVFRLLFAHRPTIERGGVFGENDV